MTLKAWIVLINRMKDDVDTVFFLFFFDSVSLGVTPPLAPRLLLAPTFSLVMMALMMMLYALIMMLMTLIIMALVMTLMMLMMLMITLMNDVVDERIMARR